ncbi:MAG TPA: ABC transporter permease [Gammaproteobacteria bacterium]|nr:ABC transporter permease [Gammaproteobacteria bacterium]
MDIQVIIENLPLYVSGLWVTIQLVTLALICGLVLAIPMALAASSRNIFTAFLPKAYIYFFRGTPLLVQMYIIYYGMAQFEAVRESFVWVVFQEAYWCALIAFSLNTAAYTAEIMRGAIEQTSFGEIEAAKACGMSTPTMYRRIILPGAFRRALPAYGNEVIFMLHGSAIAGVITIVDLFGAARIVNSRHFVPFESFIAAGFFYLCVTFMIVWLFKIWEKRWHAHLRPRESVAGKPAALAPTAGGVSD